MSYNLNDERQRDLLDSNTSNEQISPLSNRFLVAHSSPVLESATEVIIRAQDDSFQSSSSTSNSKSSSSTTSRSSRLHYLLMQQHSAVNSPLMYSRCTSLGSLSSYDIRSSCNDSYTSECSSVKPSGIISPSDIPDSPPCEPEVLEEEEEEDQQQQRQQHIKITNRTLTMNTTSNNNRTTTLSETVIEKTLTLNQHDSFSNRINDVHGDEQQETYLSDHSNWNSNHIDSSSHENELCFDDDYPRIFNSENDDNDSLIDDHIQYDASFAVPLHENLSVITEESSFIEEIHSNDETNSIKILYDLIKKPHWTNKSTSNQRLPMKSSHLEENNNASISSNPSSLSLDSNDGNQTDDDDDDDDEYDQEKGRQLIQRLIEETLARRSVPTDYLHLTSCVHCPLNTPMTAETRSISSSSSSVSASTKSCACVPNRSSNSISQPQRSQSSPARPSSTGTDDTKRPASKQKENTIHHTRTSYLRLLQAQQNKRRHQHDKKS